MTPKTPEVAPAFDIAARLEGLALALAEGAWLWRPRPFATPTPPWAERAPELAEFCLGLDEAAVVALEEGAALPPGAPALLVDWVERLARLTRVGAVGEQAGGAPGGVPMGGRPPRNMEAPMGTSAVSLGPAPASAEASTALFDGATAPTTSAPALRGPSLPFPRDATGAALDWRWQIPGRKLEQVLRFAEAVDGLVVASSARSSGRGITRVLDWCGGRGHLGRTLGLRLGLPVSVVELDWAHAEPARQLAERLGVALELVACDALSDDAAALVARLDPHMLVVGLHACGALGERLVGLASAHGVMALAHSPCCLHKIPGLKGSRYQPMSRTAGMALSAAAPHGDLVLDHSALRLATSDEVVARPALRLARQKENTWRLALDLLLQDALGSSDYIPLGTLPSELLSGAFETFAREAASRRGFALPAEIDAERALSLGAARAHRARRFGLVRSLFRRAIELFVVLDRASFLADDGYEVSVGEFAPRRVTPRNLLITARLAR